MKLGPSKLENHFQDITRNSNYYHSLGDRLLTFGSLLPMFSDRKHSCHSGKYNMRL